jgi:PAS domain S-box-containing protein
MEGASLVSEVHTNHRLALSLAQALIEYANTPLILLDGELRVVSASRSFCRDFGIDCATVDGKLLLEVSGGEWDIGNLRAFLEAEASSAREIATFEMDFKRRDGAVRRLILTAQKLDYVGIQNTRLLLAIADVTEARAAERLKDDLVREKEILLQEVQHRVGNSLQIIAGVLLQRARMVQSERNPKVSPRRAPPSDVRSILTKASGRFSGGPSNRETLFGKGMREHRGITGL